MTPLYINYKDKKIRVWALKTTQGLWIHHAGQTHLIETAQSGKQRNFEGGGNKNVLSPMPGKILSVNCTVGDEVKKGEVLVVMEAMKMEYSLESSLDGVVEEVNCSEGDQVSPEALLVKITGKISGKNNEEN